MLHKNCGGKLPVVESAQKTVDDDVVIYRIRKCPKCGKKINSFEVVEDAEIHSGYIHKSTLTQDELF